jgi:PAS domain S-box-containing protein
MSSEPRKPKSPKPERRSEHLGEGERLREPTRADLAAQHRAARRRAPQASDAPAAARDARGADHRYRALLEFVSDGYFETDERGVVLDCNGAAERLLGAPPGAIQGQSLLAFVDRKDHKQVGYLFERLSHAHAMSPLEVTLRPLDGRTLAAMLVVAPAIDAQGRVTGARCSVRDLADRKSAERGLREREAMLRGIVDSAADAIVAIDAQGAIRSFNPAAQRTFGYELEEVLGRNVKLLMPQPFCDEHDGYLRRYAATGVRHIIGLGRELIGIRKDGTTFPMELTISEAVTAEGSLFTGIVRDISTRRRMEEEFRRAQKMEVVGRLASGIAHDFNNLLAGIIGCSGQVLRSLEPGHPATESVNEIKCAAERGAALSRELLNFGRPKSGAAVPVRLNDVVRTSEHMLRQVIGEDVHMQVELCASGAPIRGDGSRLEQILTNLAVNARDALPKGGRLKISTREIELVRDMHVRGLALHTGRYAVLEVEDTGTGMDDATLDRLFEPFFTTKDVGLGTGLGLYTVYGIVHQLGGAVDVASKLGAGTRFTLYLPSNGEVVADQPAPANAARVSAPGGGETIVLVEDERLLRAILRKLLAHYGYQVLCATDPDEALRVVAEHAGPIDLLLTDMVMPGSSGADLARAMADLRPGLKVVFMSAFPAEVLVEQGRIQAGVRTLEKPFSDEALLGAVREALTGAGA